VNAGIEESNAHSDGEECFVLWPEHLQATINQLWERLRAHYQVQHLGLVVTDSRTFPLRWGVVGTTVGYCGFKAINNQIGQKDIFGREIHMVQVNAAEAIGVAATFEMGEVGEITPLAVATDLSKIVFTQTVPSVEELAATSISITDDVYAPLLTAVTWQKGGKNHDA
jgi:F420-0:gamma-glutamyl ligase